MTYMLVRIEVHQDDHHAVVRGPPDDEGSYDDHTDAKRFDFGAMDEPPPVDVVLVQRVFRSFLLKCLVTLCNQ